MPHRQGDHISAHDRHDILSDVRRGCKQKSFRNRGTCHDGKLQHTENMADSKSHNAQCNTHPYMMAADSNTAEQREKKKAPQETSRMIKKT